MARNITDALRRTARVPDASARIPARMMEGLAAEMAVAKTVMIGATYLNAHRAATGLRSKLGG